MPKLATYKRIITSDFDQKDKKLVEQIAFSINDGFNALYGAVDGKLALTSNIFCTVKDVEVIVNASGIPTNSASFMLDKTGQVLGTQVLYAANQVNSAVYPTAQPFISYTQNGTSVIINHISGLQANQRYIVRIVAYLN